MYYFVGARQRIYLIYAYAKNVKDDLTRAEENEFRKLAEVLKEEG